MIPLDTCQSIEGISWPKYTFCLVPVYIIIIIIVVALQGLHLLLLGNLTREGLMGETDERSEKLSLLLQGEELVVEVCRDFENMGLLSLLLQPGELVVQVNRMSPVC